MFGAPMRFNFADMLARGLEGEAAVREWLRLEGYFVLPTSLIKNGGAPALVGHVKDIIATNNLISRDGESLWAEVKTYQRATFNRKYGRREHGIPIRLWEEYREGERVSGIRGSLWILTVEEKRIYSGLFDAISVGARYMRELHPRSGPQIFFDLRCFDWHPVAPTIRLPDDLPPETIRPWETEATRREEGRQAPLL